MFTERDLLYLKSKGINKENVEEQVEILKKNYSFQKITSPALLGKGILAVEDHNKYISLYDNNINRFRVQKFVPASGAATRMFKRLINFNNEPSLKNLNEGGFYSVKTSFEEIEKFAFFDKLRQMDFELTDLEELAEKILFSGLGYADIPKGLIDFHKYPDGPGTPLEEHIIESSRLSTSSESMNIHFTISPEFKEKFEKKLAEIKTKKDLNMEIEFSFQEKSTDTLAIYENEEPVRDDDSNLLLRPGGHGALLQNLNKLDGDFIFIKNIDNVVHQSYLDETVSYKKLLGGVLIEIIDKLSGIYNIISDSKYTAKDVQTILDFLNINFGTKFGEETTTAEILKFIDRPVRVCGMVKNTGEPGGGPFWTINSEGEESLQIVEKAQINLSEADQEEIFNNSTHFNPVDMVCYLKNPDGKRFDLNKYVDRKTSFISQKTYKGNNIRVLEHPGLWNGAMSDWITIFVEVPLLTFNPVKELNDLLRKEHQPTL